MKDQITDEQTQAVLKALDDAINNGPWDKSNFLRLIGKNLTGIREDFLNKLGLSAQAKLNANSKQAAHEAHRSGQREVYVSIYSTTGADMVSWERIVANLPRQMTSRPIYAEEEDVKNIIRLKENKINEAYVVIYVNQSDVLALSADKTSMDKLGKPLLALKSNTLILDNVTRFVHSTGVYRLDHSHLIKL